MEITPGKDLPFLWVQTGISVRPDEKCRWAFLFILVVLICMSLVVSETSKRINQPLLQCLYWMCYFVGIFCYMYTGMANAGVIIRDENNAIENGDDLEKQDYCYCSICQLYRPPKANHCPICGFCFYKYLFWWRYILVMITIVE